jgi:hypothetical protein
MNNDHGIFSKCAKQSPKCDSVSKLILFSCHFHSGKRQLPLKKVSLASGKGTEGERKVRLSQDIGGFSLPNPGFNFKGKEG